MEFHGLEKWWNTSFKKMKFLMMWHTWDPQFVSPIGSVFMIQFVFTFMYAYVVINDYRFKKHTIKVGISKIGYHIYNIYIHFIRQHNKKQSEWKLCDILWNLAMSRPVYLPHLSCGKDHMDKGCDSSTIIVFLFSALPNLLSR